MCSLMSYVYLLCAGVLEEAKFFGIEELYSQLEGLCVTVNKPRDDLALTRRDVIDVLMATSSSASEMRFQGVNLVGKLNDPFLEKLALN